VGEAAEGVVMGAGGGAEAGGERSLREALCREDGVKRSSG
jgi:hypothetical protein